MSMLLRATKGSRLTHEEMDGNFNSCLGVHNLLHVEDRKAAGTDGGTFTSGAWRTRDLNTVVTNNIAGASLASNQVTLPAGEYWVEGRAPAYTVRDSKAQIYNVTDPTSLIIGSNARGWSDSFNAVDAWVMGKFELSVESTIEFQHISSFTKSSNGFGVAEGFSVIELYSVLKIWKVG